MSEAPASNRPRYSASPLPPYSYVPGWTPHPLSDVRGHMFGQIHSAPTPLNVDAWHDSEAYRYGVDLFNHGFYWESHEAWESLWRVAVRTSAVAVWLKALIKLAAAAVKAREGNATGVARHAARSLELLDEVGRKARSQQTFCGISVASVQLVAEALCRSAARRFAQPQPEVILDERLELAAPAISRPM